MGVGEKASVDERGRITIPSDIRKTIGKKYFKITLLDKDTIILKAITNHGDILEKIQNIKLTGDPEKTSTDFSTIKDMYSGKHLENP
jgi:bifunctional DNA-binding transcriptional regulator/antitoxin component of YhaV-PrlF toxin-antitoxin module